MNMKTFRVFGKWDRQDTSLKWPARPPPDPTSTFFLDFLQEISKSQKQTTLLEAVAKARGLLSTKTNSPSRVENDIIDQHSH